MLEHNVSDTPGSPRSRSHALRKPGVDVVGHSTVATVGKEIPHGKAVTGVPVPEEPHDRPRRVVFYSEDICTESSGKAVIAPGVVTGKVFRSEHRFRRDASTALSIGRYCSKQSDRCSYQVVFSTCMRCVPSKHSGLLASDDVCAYV